MNPSLNFSSEHIESRKRKNLQDFSTIFPSNIFKAFFENINEIIKGILQGLPI